MLSRILPLLPLLLLLLLLLLFLLPMLHHHLPLLPQPHVPQPLPVLRRQ
jgi:hypothetical protein